VTDIPPPPPARAHEPRRSLSDEHKRVVEEWRRATPLSTPELHFIRTSRDLILKGGRSRAIPSFRNLRRARDRTSRFVTGGGVSKSSKHFIIQKRN